MEEERPASEARCGWVEQIRDDLLASVRKTAACLRSASPSAEQIHRARRLLKRSSALALLLAPAVGAQAERAARDIRAFRRQLGAARDLDVIGEALEQFTPALGTDLSVALNAGLARRRSALEAQALPADRSALRRELRWLADEIGRWKLENADVGGLVVALSGSYRKARRRGVVAFRTWSPIDLHELRKATIAHQEQLATFEAIWPRAVRAWCAETQHLRDALGQLNDLTMLAGFAQDGADGVDASPLREAIAAARARASARAEPTFGRLFCERPRDVARRLEAWFAHAKREPLVGENPAAEAKAQSDRERQPAPEPAPS